MAQPIVTQVTHNQINNIPASGLNVTLPAGAAAGDALVAIVFGQKGMDPFGQRTDTNPYNNLQGATPAPVYNDDQANVWASIKSITNVDVISGTPSFPSTAVSVPDLATVFPSVYIAAALNVAATTQRVNVRSSYLGQNNPWSAAVAYLIGDAVTVGGVVYVCILAHTNHTPPNATYWTAATVLNDSRFAGGPGKPAFGGLDVVLLDISGIATAAATDGTPVAATSAANPAVAGAITTTVFGDLIIAVALQKDSNAFSAPAGWTVAASGKLIGSEEHYIVMYQIQGASSAATITNLALTSNVVTITAANHFFAGAQVALAGLTTSTFLNGQTVTVIATGLSTTQFEFNFTHADVGTGAETGTATGFQATSGAITPGFTNPTGRIASGFDPGPTTSAGYETVVVAAALKHS